MADEHRANRLQSLLLLGRLSTHRDITPQYIHSLTHMSAVWLSDEHLRGRRTNEYLVWGIILPASWLLGWAKETFVDANTAVAQGNHGIRSR